LKGAITLCLGQTKKKIGIQRGRGTKKKNKKPEKKIIIKKRGQKGEAVFLVFFS
jgi:hypothetical protein